MSETEPVMGEREAEIREALNDPWHDDRDPIDDIRWLLARVATLTDALQYTDECFERDGDPVTVALREAKRIAEAWAARNEDARHVSSLIASVLPPLADAGGVVRAALSSLPEGKESA